MAKGEKKVEEGEKRVNACVHVYVLSVQRGRGDWWRPEATIEEGEKRGT